MVGTAALTAIERTFDKVQAPDEPAGSRAWRSMNIRTSAQIISAIDGNPTAQATLEELREFMFLMILSPVGRGGKRGVPICGREIPPVGGVPAPPFPRFAARLSR